MSLQKINTNPFEVDLEFARNYERKFARKYGGYVTCSNKDDEGVDVTISHYVSAFSDLHVTDNDWYRCPLYVDVKAYRCPLYRPRFNGVFIEEHSGEKKKRFGWYKKLLLGKARTTDYVFYINCRQTGLGGYTYLTCYHITKWELIEAIKKAKEDGALQHTECKTADGFILPYKYLRQYGREIDGG